METNSTIVKNLFQFLQENKYHDVVKLYAKDAFFTDDVFNLSCSDSIVLMWQYLAFIFTDLHIKVVRIIETQDGAVVDWESFYQLRGKKIHNKLRSHFIIENGRILRQTDQFSFYRIARQTSGLKGWLLGWLPSVKKTMQNRLLSGFDQFSPSKSKLT